MSGVVLPSPPTLYIPVPAYRGLHVIYFDFKSRPPIKIASYAYVHVYHLKHTCRKDIQTYDILQFPFQRPSSFCEAFCRRWLALVKDTKELCHFRLLRRGTNGELSQTAETSDIGEQTKPASVFQRVPRLSRPSIFSISVDSMASSCLSNDVDFQSDVRRKATLRSAAHNSQSRLQNGSVFSQPSLTRGRHLYRRRGQENAGFTIDPQDFTAPDTGWHSPVAVRTPHIGDNSLL